MGSMSGESSSLERLSFPEYKRKKEKDQKSTMAADGDTLIEEETSKTGSVRQEWSYCIYLHTLLPSYMYIYTFNKVC